MPYKNNRNSREDKSLKHNRFEGNSKNERPKRSNSRSEKRFEGDKPQAKDDRFRDRSSGSSGDHKQPRRRREDSSNDARSSFRDKERGPKPFGRPAGEKRSSEGGRRERSEGYSPRPFKNESSAPGRRDKFRDRNDSFEKKPGYTRRDRSETNEKSFTGKPFGERRPDRRTSAERGEGTKSFRPRSRKYENGEDRKWTSEEHMEQQPVLRGRKNKENTAEEPIRLNRYIANAGICSRRKADELIEAGVISVNGEVISELGFKVNPFKDEIRYNGELLRREKMVYVLLNKPKDYITTTDDPQERKTVMQLVEKASKERIYPIGRLDRNTTGLLLMTNDGDLAEKLSHPRNNITKIYQVELSKNLTQGDLNKIAFGIELEDGFIKPDAVSYVQGGTKREIGIQIHSGKNRIVRRIFEHLGYEVVKLDRVVYANLTKKDLPRGRWRYLEEKEIIQLKHLIK